MRVVLKATKKTPEEERELKKRLTAFAREIFSSNAAQLEDIVDGKPIEETSFKRMWWKLIKRFKVIAEMNGEFTSMANLYLEIRSEICIYVKENWEELSEIPSSEFPRVVFWKLYGYTDEKLRQANINKLSLDYDDQGNVEDFTGSFSAIEAHSMYSQGKRYILIEGIAEAVGLSAETLRNWERKGKISFEKITHHSSMKKATYLRGVLYDDVPRFIEKMRQIQEQDKPPIGYVSSKEACEKLDIHHTTLKRRRDAGKYEHIKIGNRFFYKI